MGSLVGEENVKSFGEKNYPKVSKLGYRPSRGKKEKLRIEIWVAQVQYVQGGLKQMH